MHFSANFKGSLFIKYSLSLTFSNASVMMKSGFIDSRLNTDLYGRSFANPSAKDKIVLLFAFFFRSKAALNFSSVLKYCNSSVVSLSWEYSDIRSNLSDIIDGFDCLLPITSTILCDKINISVLIRFMLEKNIMQHKQFWRLEKLRILHGEKHRTIT